MTDLELQLMESFKAGQRVTTTYAPGKARGTVVDGKVRKGSIDVAWDAAKPGRQLDPMPHRVSTLRPLEP